MQGYIPTPPEQYALLETMQDGTFRSHLNGFGAGKLCLPFKSVLQFEPKAFTDDAQGGGDCTAQAARNAYDISRSVEIHLKGEPESWEARSATELIYGYRGHSGEGMNPGRATEFLLKFGNLLRGKYGSYDFTKYSYNTGHRWGRSGPPRELLDLAAAHKCRYYMRITSVEQARDALAAGYGIHCGSSYGNDGKRDSRGVARWNRSWNHDMSWGGFDDTTGQLYFLVLNSWGIWNSGGHPEWGPLPGGSFLIPESDAEKMIRSGECWAHGDVDGWPARDLPDYGTGDYL